MQTIYLDISNKGVTPTIYAKQGDVGRKFQVVLTDSGLPYSPASGSAFSVWYAGASGDGNYTEIGDKSAFSVNGNKVTVEMIAQMLSNDGDGVLSLVLNDPNANQISTWNIPYICESVPGADSEEAKDYYTAFSKAVENLPYPDTSLSVAGKAADAAAVGAALSGKAPALDWSHLKWYVMGDSLTDRNASNTEKYYYDFVQEKTGIQVIVDGIGGTGYGAGASDGESYYERVQNIPDDVDIVTIFGSGNDIRFANGANTEIWNTMNWLVLNRPGLRVIVVPPSPWKDYNKREDPWKAYCDRLQACASVCNFRYVSDMYDCPPFNPNFTGHMEVFFTTDPEGIHPDENGHKALAPYFYNALLQELALDSDVETPGGGGSGQNVTLTTAQITALDGMFKVCAYDDSKDISGAYEAFKDAFGLNIRATGITLSKTTLNFTETASQLITATVEPSNSTDTVVWTTSAPGVATVVNGVVTPVANGNCTITATAGKVSASCSVSVAFEVEVVYYTVTNNLTNCVSNNNTASIVEGGSYTATLTADEGYTLDGASVSVMVNGEDVTDTAYADGVITIQNVLGNVVITATAVEVVDESDEVVMLKNISFDGTSYLDTGVIPESINYRYVLGIQYPNKDIVTNKHIGGISMRDTTAQDKSAYWDIYWYCSVSANNYNADVPKVAFMESCMGMVNGGYGLSTGLDKGDGASTQPFDYPVYYNLGNGSQSMWLNEECTEPPVTGYFPAVTTTTDFTNQANYTDDEHPIDSIWLGKVHVTGIMSNLATEANTYAGIKFYCFKVYDSDENLIADMHPAKQGSTVGMWDNVRNKFYPATGTANYEEVTA